MTGRTQDADPFGGVGEQMKRSFAASWEMWSALATSWQSVLSNRGMPAAQAVTDRLLKPAAWPDAVASLLAELQRIFALPQFSDLPLLDAEALPSLAPAAELLAVANQFMLAALPLWVRASQRFQAEMAASGTADAPALPSAGDAMDVLNNVLDQTLMEFNRSAEFSNLLQRLLRAGMGYRNEARKFGEKLARTVDMPTRTEMTDVYQRLHDLQREMHALRRELRAMKQAGPTPPARRSPARKGGDT